MSGGALNSSAAGTMRPSSTSIRLVGHVVATLSSRKMTKTYWRKVGKRSPNPHQAVTQEADDIGRPDVALLM